MSQKKMEAYKEAKKNKRQIEKKQKRNKILGWILGIIIAAALIGGSAYLVYYSSVILPNKQSEAEATTQDATVEEINIDENGEVLDGTAEDTITVDPAETDDTENVEDAANTEDTGVDVIDTTGAENTDATATDEAATNETATEEAATE